MISRGGIAWISGLSGAGKSTICDMILRKYSSSNNIVYLDGDILRGIFGAVSFDRDSRVNLAIKYLRLSEEIASQGFCVLISTISMFHEVYHELEKSGYVSLKVFIDVPMCELERRDPKRLYSRLRSGEISNISGVDLAVDPPGPEFFHIEWDSARSLDDMFDEIDDLFESRFFK